MLHYEGSLLVGGPTTGKSFLLSKLQREGVTAVDTDDIVKDKFSLFWRLKPWTMSGKEARIREALEAGRDAVASLHILSHQPKLVLSNLWSRQFLTDLFGSRQSGSRINAIAVFRVSALEVAKLSKKRGEGLSIRLTRNWVNSAKEQFLNLFSTVVWLPNGVFLSDVVTVVGNRWTLTSLGEHLTKLDFDSVAMLTPGHIAHLLKGEFNVTSSESNSSSQ
jgi:hypothetical protein